MIHRKPTTTALLSQKTHAIPKNVSWQQLGISIQNGNIQPKPQKQRKRRRQVETNFTQQ